MNTTLDKIRGIGKDSLTLCVFNTAGFRTFESLLRFKEQDNLLVDAIQKIKTETQYESHPERFWKKLLTRCINIIHRCQNGKSYFPSIPNAFLCPISLELMEDPVITPSGISYEREHITKWMMEHQNTDPLTRVAFSQEDLIPNLNLKEAIEDYKRDFTTYTI